jgi:acyl-CoA reductase-like NAD-dependent aldehyde dehydrogenase
MISPEWLLRQYGKGHPFRQRLWRQAPVACFMKFSSEDDVLGLANDNTFGLSASVWTKNTARGIMVANALQAGTVWVNSHLDSLGNDELPWGGFKESGSGKEGSVMGL